LNEWTSRPEEMRIKKHEEKRGSDYVVGTIRPTKHPGLGKAGGSKRSLRQRLRKRD